MTPPRLRSWLPIALALAAAWLLASVMPAVVESLKSYPHDGKMDWLAARAWLDGFSPYTEEGFQRIGKPALGMGHPPTTGFWFLPFARLELQPMSAVVGQLTLVMLLIHLVAALVEIGAPAPLPTAALLFALVLSTTWMKYHLGLAQTSELIAFLYLLAWLSLRRGRELAGGACLGLACTLKLFPGLLVLPLLLGRRWRAVAAAIAAWAAVAAVMTWRFGIASWPQFVAWQKPITAFWVGDLANGSLHGIALRMLHAACNGNPAPHTDSWVIAMVFSLALLVIGWRLGRRAFASNVDIDLPFAYFSLLSYFLNPWFWEHYNLFLIVPLLVAAAALVDGARRGMSRAWAAAGASALGLVVMLLGVDQSTKHLARKAWRGHTGPHWRVHAYEIANWLPTVIMLALVGALLYWNERRRARV